MFNSLNLFKSFSCPHVNCERPYCPFGHNLIKSTNKISTSTATATVTSTTTTTKTTAPEKVEVVENAEKIIKKEIPTSTPPTTTSVYPLKEKENEKKTAQPAEDLQNLQKALQSVQQLYIKTMQDASTGDSNSVEIGKSLLGQITTLQTMIQQKTPKEEEKTPPRSKKRSYGGPEYNPTPIKELQKLKEEKTPPDHPPPKIKKESNDMDDSIIEIVEIKKEKVKPKYEVISADTVKPKPKVQPSAPKQQSQPQPQKPPTAQPAPAPAAAAVNFSKLTLSQQVAKRYEMLNKQVPTPAQLHDAKMRKLNNKIAAVNSTISSSSSGNNTSVPQLIVDQSSSNKVPLAFRQRYLMLIFENGKSMFPTLAKACEKAAQQEKSIYDRSKAKGIYLNLAANLVSSLRAEHAKQQRQQQQPTEVRNEAACSHESMLGGPKAARVSFSINRIRQIEHKDLSMIELYEMFLDHVLTEEQLYVNSFPRWSSDEISAFIPNFQLPVRSQQPKQKPTQVHEDGDDGEKKKPPPEEEVLTKYCKRCQRTFQLLAMPGTDTLLYLASNSECVYHWGKNRTVRVDKAPVQQYSCCGQETNSEGCANGLHVYDGAYDGFGTGKNMTGFVETKPNPANDQSETAHNIYGIDCEMCYTTGGLELARISVVDLRSNEVYESLVKPANPILDYNTRWSGLTEELLRDCKTTIEDIQNDLLGLFDSNTILLGHSLESDFKALKLIHKRVVDTSVVFPHKMGPPFKRALKMLMSEHLQKVIQEDTDGHDSKEDANACVLLMLWKINEMLKSKKPVDLYKRIEASFRLKQRAQIDGGKMPQTSSTVNTKSSNSVSGYDSCNSFRRGNSNSSVAPPANQQQPSVQQAEKKSYEWKPSYNDKKLTNFNTNNNNNRSSSSSSSTSSLLSLSSKTDSTGYPSFSDLSSYNKKVRVTNQTAPTSLVNSVNSAVKLASSASCSTGNTRFKVNNNKKPSSSAAAAPTAARNSVLSSKKSLMAAVLAQKKKFNK